MQEIASPIPATHLAPPNRARFVVPALLFAALALAPLLGLLGAERYVLSLFTRCIIFAIAAVGLDLALGYGGLVSFGHAAFIGIGGYAAGILTASGIDDAFIGLFAALAASGLFALATGAISLKTRGVHFIMITLAFGQMAYFLANSLKAYGGDDGLTLRQSRHPFRTRPPRRQSRLLLCGAGDACWRLSLRASRRPVALRTGAARRQG